MEADEVMKRAVADGKEVALAGALRGEVLDKAIQAELAVAQIISVHFVRNRELRGQFNALVMYRDGISFRTKIRILRELLKHVYPELAKAYPGLATELEHIRDFRNLVAHAPPADSGEVIEEPQGFYVARPEKGGLVKRFVSTEEVERMLAQWNRTFLTLLGVAIKIECLAAQGQAPKET